MIGSIAILLLISIARGVQSDVTKEVRDIGVNLLIVLPGRVEEDGGFNPNLGGQSFLKEEDVETVRKVPGVVRAIPLTFAGGGAKAGDKTAYPVNIAVNHEWFSIHKAEMAEGRTLAEQDSLTPVCVLGGVAKKNLFGDAPSLGKEVSINGVKYKVVGATKSAGEGSSLFAMFSFQNVIYIPYDLVKRTRTDMQIDRIMVQTAPEVEPKGLKNRIDQELGKRLDHQQYSVLTQEDLLGLVFKLMNILTWLVTGLTSIAVFVGGIGIMTAMLMSVNERAKEIGIRKTVGANNRDVFRHFLAEALLITTFGCLIGLAISFVVALCLRQWTPIKPIFTLEVFATAFGVGIGMGTLFGIIPAINASKKDPIEALRRE